MMRSKSTPNEYRQPPLRERSGVWNSSKSAVRVVHTPDQRRAPNAGGGRAAMPPRSQDQLLIGMVGWVEQNKMATTGADDDLATAQPIG
jgi:hypothetical protein